MADTTDVLGIPFPEGGDTFKASDIEDLAARVDEVPGVESLTSAEIAALAAGEKPEGRVVYNSTTGKLMVSNGTTFVEPYGLWTAWTPTLTASSADPSGYAVTANENRYTRIGQQVAGVGHVAFETGDSLGTGTWRIPLPVTPTSTSVPGRQIGRLTVFGSDASSQDEFTLEQASGATYCIATRVSAGARETLTAAMLALQSMVVLYAVWQFDYEAA